VSLMPGHYNLLYQQRKSMKKVYKALYGQQDMKVVPQSKIDKFNWSYISDKNKEEESE